MTPPGRVVSLNVSAGTGTKKVPKERVRIGPEGIAGDGHAGPGHRQVSLLSQEEIDRFSAEAAGGRPYPPGVFAENVTTRGVDLAAAALLDRLRVGPAVLEVTQIGKECHGQGCSVFQEAGRCVMPQAGVFCRVVRGGPVRTGDPVELQPRPLLISVITLSDRASAGVYEDLGGPRVRALLEAFLAGRRWHPAFDYTLVPDDKAALRRALARAVRKGADFIFTTGGTGIGPRDVTPEVVASFADKLIPGVMDAIRLKHAERLPAALLSRSVAGVKGTTLIYALPGSVKAVDEYLAEITRSMEHALAMLHGLGH